MIKGSMVILERYHQTLDVISCIKSYHGDLMKAWEEIKVIIRLPAFAEKITELKHDFRSWIRREITIQS